MATLPSTKERLLFLIEGLRRLREQGTPGTSPPSTGVELLLFPGVSVEGFKELRRTFVAKPSDLFVVTYQKCGTTWMQQIVTLIRNNGVLDEVDLDDRWLWIDLFTVEEVEVMLLPVQAYTRDILLIHFCTLTAIFSWWYWIVQDPSPI